ncbi:LysR family transcriptional regulator [Paraburkholderia sp. ZP32-5]|uniref:LysR family transcriptional regulator n=1 Tax=Paraburkholderia sp. ZP32-5 TaxID=2883245 RepID=UPI001F39C202|nr:LysR substrate-binding domain-containing protein [Paraburkholderia sp. ZP32-5]
MTLSQLRAFCAVVDQGSFRAASRSLDIAQSALTQAIQTLETELSVPLLTRSYAGISLTPFGKKLLTRAHAIIRECEQIEPDMREIDGAEANQIALGVTSEPLIQLLMPVLNRFRQDNPHVSVNITNSSAHLLTEHIRSGRLHFALCPLVPNIADPGLDIARLYPSSPAIIARVGHPKAGATSITELAECEWVGLRPEGIAGFAPNRLTQMFAQQGLGAPKMVFIAETPLEKLYLVSETDYLTMDPGVLTDAKLFSGALTRIPIREAFNARDVCLVRHSNSPLPAPAQALSNMLASFARLRQIVSGPLRV